MSDPADAALEAERVYLRNAREDLRRMREHTLSLDAQAGDALSQEFLKAALYRRAKSLEDDPGIPLFFGRIDRNVDSHEETFHIGRRHVMDDSGDPVVIDWRADISRAFYRATRTEPMGVHLRRRYGFRGGDISSYEDEHLTDTTEHDVTSTILTEEIERPRVGPMRDIVATIQPEQDEVVRAGLSRSVCVQGAPGTGKTAVGLHRAAYLLHAHRQQLAKSGVLVVGPNASFLDYISQVLPALGEIDVRQVTLAQLVDSVPVKHTDHADVAMIKGDARMADVLQSALWSHVTMPTDMLVVPRGSRRWRVPLSQVVSTVETMRDRGDSYQAGRTLLPQRLAHLVLLRMEAAGEITDDRVQSTVARSQPIKALANATWPAVDPVRLVTRLLSDADFLAATADGILSDDEQRAVLWRKPAKGPKSAPWSHADAVLVDEAKALVERMRGVGHVVLDEAQDLSPMELRAVGRRAATGSVTVLGDIAQGTTPWATPTWDAALAHLGQRDTHLEVLEKGYRVPASVVEFAARLLPVIAPTVAAPQPVRSNPGQLDIVPASGDAAEQVAATTAKVSERLGSVGVIAADDGVATIARALENADVEFVQLPDGHGRSDVRVSIVPVSLAKGLEFDHVIVAEPAAIVAAEPRGMRRLYVVLTRAVSSLTVVHALPLPSPLRAS